MVCDSGCAIVARVEGFGDEIRAARRRSGMSRRALAERSGVHQPTIAAIETGRRPASDAVRAALVAAVRIRPSEALARHRDEAHAVLARHDAVDVRVFGSVARGSDDVGSDLDLLVTLPVGADLVDVLDLTEELEQLLGVHVDVVSGRGTGPVVERARQESVPL